MILKFTNVKYYKGGGKKPLRIRTAQNIRILTFKEGIEKMSKKELVKNLFIITKGRIIPTQTTKVKIIL